MKPRELDAMLPTLKRLDTDQRTRVVYLLIQAEIARVG